MKINTSALVSAITPIALASALVACGGGGNSGASPVGSDNLGSAVFDVSISTDQNTTVQAGNTIPLVATARTSDAPLKTLAWSVTSAPGAPALGLSNNNCAVGAKVTNLKSSAWDCAVSITAPVTGSNPVDYTLQFTATDTLGNTRTVMRPVRAQYDPTYTVPPPVIGVLTMPAFSVASGATAPLVCPAATGTTISWFVTNNGGSVISLSSYNAAQSGFVAPTVTTPTPVTISCTTIDSSKNISNGNVVVTVLPPATPVPTAVTVSPAQSIVSGAVGTATVTVAGITAPLYYQWTLVGTPTPTPVLAGASTSTVSFVAPTVGAATTYAFQVNYGLQPITASYTGIGQAQAVVVVRP